MFRKLMSTTALVAAVSLPGMTLSALASDATTSASSSIILAQSETGVMTDVMVHSNSQMLASTITGADVYSNTMEDADAIASVSDLVVDTTGMITDVVLSVGGVLDVGDTDVAVAWDQIALQDVDGELRVIVDYSEEQLEAMDPFVPFNERESAMMDGQNDDMLDATQLREGYDAVDVTTLSAENLIGARLYGASDDDLGKIGDVILSADGSIEAIVVDFGGFLGIAEKPVALQFETVSIMRETDGDDLSVFTGLTEEQLEAAVEYNSDTYGTAGNMAIDAS